jgi:hypothetical protein
MAGFRHTGEVLELSLVSLPALELGPIGRTQLPAAVMDLTAFQQVTPVAGVLSLQLLEHVPFELDLRNRRLILNPAPSARNAENSSQAHGALIRQHPVTLEIYVPIFLAGQRLGWAQLDTGSPQTYIHAWWEPLLRHHGQLYAREQQSWTGRRDSVEYWSSTDSRCLTQPPPAILPQLRSVRLSPMPLSGLTGCARVYCPASSTHHHVLHPPSLVRLPRRRRLTNVAADEHFSDATASQWLYCACS